jgi:uncharacterized protein YjbI with pentapeptide repeats
MSLNEEGIGTITVNGETYNIRPTENLQGAHLRGADLRGADLTEAILTGADLREAQLIAAELAGTDLSEADLTEVDLRGAHLEEANLTDANLRGANIRGAHLIGATLIGADLSGADLRGADLTGTTFVEANLRSADLRNANLREAHLINSNLGNANLEEAHLEEAQLRLSNFRGANLTRAVLIGADLRGAILGRANLTEADLRAANLEEADLRQAILIGANLEEANLTEADLAGANLERAIMPRIQPHRPQGRAYEIHNAFAALNMEQFMDIIENNTSSAIITNNDNDAILNPFIQYVQSKNIPEEEKQTMITNLTTIQNAIQTEGSLNEPANREFKEKLQKIINYVLQQPSEFIDLYLKNYTFDCLNAYNPGDSSCVKGMIERIVMIIRDVIATFCSEQDSPLCKPEYIELLNTFYPEIDINRLFQEWYNANFENNNIINMDAAQRKSHFINFVREKITPDQYNHIEERVNNYIEENHAIFENLTLGGKKTPKNKTAKKHIHQKITKIKKTKIKKTKIKKTKNKKIVKRKTKKSNKQNQK